MTHDSRTGQFPYMHFARGRGERARHSLLDSGMPPPDASFLADPSPPDLGPPEDALADLEARLAEHLDQPPERVLATLGTSGALYTAARHWFRPGSRVAVELPSYEPLRALPPGLGAEIRTVERRLDADWTLDPADVADALAGPSSPDGPGHVLLSNPHNPTGAVLSASTLRALAEVAAAAGGLLICDEVYMEFAPPDQRVRACDLAPNTVSLGSLTKAYGLGALRVGWVALGPGTSEERAPIEESRLLDYVDPPSVASRLALRALDHLDALRARVTELEREARPLFSRWLEETPGVIGQLPPHGIVGFPRLTEIEDTRALAHFLAEHFDVDVVPGEFFGRAGHVRLGFGLPAAVLRPALEQLTAGLAAFRATGRH